MLKFFEVERYCHIVIEYPFVREDEKSLNALFAKEYLNWHIEFGRIYSVNTTVIDMLYREIFINSKNVRLTTHKSKLNRYLNSLGFTARFDSLIKEDIVKVNDIKVVLIGGSADSSSKIIEIVKHTSFSNITLIVVQHVEANRVGIFDEILQKYTQHRISYAKDGERIAKAKIYLAPNNKHLKVVDGFFSLSDSEKYNYAKPSVSISYESFSNYYREKLLVIQECGYASDGVDKLELVKENGSGLIVQHIDECSAKPMIQNALNVDVQDFIFNIKDIITYINIINNQTTREAWVDYLLDKVYEKFNYDFKLYHRDMLNRRINVFMLKHEIKSIKDAVVAILFNKSAFKGFFLEVSINVTELFRNPESFEVIAELLEKNYKRTRSLKIWSAGCSSGEEVYSIAIILDSLALLDKALLYATDFNSVILEEAKNGIYSNDSYLLAKENFSKIGLKTALDEYIIKNNNYVTIDEKIKEKTLFFQHNLIEDSSFNEFDIIICKNVIIYFDNNLQKKVFQLFYDSLKFGGYLVLGESEMVHLSFSSKFKHLNSDLKIFKKVA